MAEMKVLVSHDSAVVQGKKSVHDMTNGEEYTYRTSIPLEVGNLVVVENKNGWVLGRVAQVIGLTEAQRQQACKWVVSRVDTEAHEKRVKLAAATDELKNRMRERKKEVEEQALLISAVKSDRVIAERVISMANLDPDSITSSVLQAAKTTCAQLAAPVSEENLFGEDK